MQTSLLPHLLETTSGQRADAILRKCVHCGFCTATCPTYQLLGDELDGPRGRIYQIKQMFEGQQPDRELLTHLDRCLTCRSCETTCPSGVEYAELADIGRHYIEEQGIRPLPQRLIRQLLGAILPYRLRHHLLFRLGSLFRPLLPAALRDKAPVIRSAHSYPRPQTNAQKRVLLLAGCAQSTLSPNTNSAATLLLQTLGYEVIYEPQPSCCGAVNHHLNQSQQTAQWIKRNLRQWQQLEQQKPIDAIVSSASGCGILLKDYPKVIKQLGLDIDEEQSQLLTRIRDISELLDADTLQHHLPGFSTRDQAVAYHAPCTLTHGHRLADHLLQQLSSLGYQISVPRDAHLCCGSAGTYSLLQPEISTQLRQNKLQALNASSPDLIITANVGCEHHLNSAGDTPVIHWVELLANDIERCMTA